MTVDEVISKQLFTAHTTELLDAGDYKLVVKSRGGDAEGPLQTSFRRVKYLRVVDSPRITSVHSENTEDNHVNCGGEVARALYGGRAAYGRGLARRGFRAVLLWAYNKFSGRDPNGVGDYGMKSARFCKIT